MRIFTAAGRLRRVAMAGATLVGLVAFNLVTATPSAAAGGLVYTVQSTSAHQGFLYCANYTPGPCTAVGHGQMYVLVTLNTSNTEADVHYKLVDGTAKINVDYYGPATGEEIISKTPPGVTPESGLIDVPLYLTNTPVAKTFKVKLTSASPPGDISSVGTETILPGTQIPSDCAMNLINSLTLSLTCSGRPAGQQWHFDAACIDGFFQPTQHGNKVTGNGTSTVACSNEFNTVADTGNFVLN
jgi:hypothetical protein